MLVLLAHFWPNVGGPVGLAGLYVDPALGFALGWNAWYNWAIILPTELSAAAILFNGFFPNASAESIHNINLITMSIMLVLAIGINCFGSRAYGEAEFAFSCFKILTIVSLIITGIILDLGGGTGGFIGFKNWRDPGPFVEWRAKGSLGKFLGVWSSMSQAVFAFFGTEIPGVAAGEVQNPAKNIPRAVNRVWIRMQVVCFATLFYVLAVFVAGLLVRSDDPRLTGPTTGSPGHTLVLSSPFVIAMEYSHLKHLEHICNAAFVISAFSAATSDVYISSRFLYYLSRCGHAPRFCAAIYHSKRKKTVIPWVGILVSACIALLAFMSVSQTSAEEIFHWLSSLNSTTALLSWIGMLFTYLRMTLTRWFPDYSWYQGTIAKEKDFKDFKQTHQELYKNRYRMQPWIAIYAFVMCVLILIFNGWFVFTRPGPWRMARELDDIPVESDPDIGNWVPTFVSSYLAIPFFLLAILGYKLIFRTKMVTLREMRFDRGYIHDDGEEIPTTRWSRLLAVLF
uniref:Amino acid permease/ SLC12A domain-containing protein n=2 Tax=Psilocybe cubensis TaxID=181762 RepID=A0A8H8CLS1_PSICU